MIKKQLDASGKNDKQHPRYTPVKTPPAQRPAVAPLHPAVSPKKEDTRLK